MAFQQLEYKSGVLGQGCYINRYLSRPGLLHCRLPATIVLSLMDFGRWHLIKQSSDIYLPDALRSQKFRLNSLHSKLVEQRAKINNALAESHRGDGSQNPANSECTAGLMPLNTIIECYWRADNRAIERAVIRLRQNPADILQKRLSRILISIQGTTQLVRDGKS